MSIDIQEAFAHRTRVDAFMREHRTSLVTLLFTDLEGSTALKQSLGDRSGVALLQVHHECIRALLKGYPEAAVVDTAGDSFFIVFTRPSEAVRFAIELQRELRRLSANLVMPLRNRIGIHVGEVVLQSNESSGWNLFGIQVDICARVMSLGTGGQVLLTVSAFDNARPVLRGEDLGGGATLAWLNHGCYRLKGVDEFVEICEVGETGIAPLVAPPDSEKACRQSFMEGDTVLGWRPAAGQHVPGTGWRLLRKLGQGGFGEVWLGRHQSLNDERVLKFCFQADRVRALRREVTIWRLLKERLGTHPQIVPIREVYFEHPPYYLVMDYCAGQDLASWSESRGGVRTVPLATRLELLAQTVEALSVVHAVGVVHRDVKPTNILVTSTPQGRIQVRLTDFGIGDLLEQERASAGITLAGFTATLTRDNGPAGSRLYLAPERWAGEKSTPAADTYSLGIILYQLLVGDLREPMALDWKDKVRGSVLVELLVQLTAADPTERPACDAALAKTLRRLERAQDRAAGRAERIHRKDRTWFRALTQLGWMLLLAGIASVIHLVPLELPFDLPQLLGGWAIALAGIATLAVAEQKYRGGFALGLGVLFCLPAGFDVLRCLTENFRAGTVSESSWAGSVSFAAFAAIVAAAGFAASRFSHQAKSRLIEASRCDLPAHGSSGSEESRISFAHRQARPRRYLILVMAFTLLGAGYAAVVLSGALGAWFVWLFAFLTLALNGVETRWIEIEERSTRSNLAKAGTSSEPHWLLNSWRHPAAALMVALFVGLGTRAIPAALLGLATALGLLSVAHRAQRSHSIPNWYPRLGRTSDRTVHEASVAAAGSAVNDGSRTSTVWSWDRQLCALCAAGMAPAAILWTNQWLLLVAAAFAVLSCRHRNGAPLVISGVAWVTMGVISVLGVLSKSQPISPDLLLLHGVFFALPGVLLASVGSQWLRATSQPGHDAARRTGPTRSITPTDEKLWKLLRDCLICDSSPETGSAPTAAAACGKLAAWRIAVAVAMMLAGFAGFASLLLGEATRLDRGVPKLAATGLLLVGLGGVAVLHNRRSRPAVVAQAAVGLLLAGWGLAKLDYGIADSAAGDAREAAIAAIYLAAAVPLLIRSRSALLILGRHRKTALVGWNSGARLAGFNCQSLRVAVYTLLFSIGAFVLLHVIENRRGRSTLERIDSISPLASSIKFQTLIALPPVSQPAATHHAVSSMRRQFLYRPAVPPRSDPVLEFATRKLRRYLRPIVDPTSPISVQPPGAVESDITTDAAPLIDIIRLVARQSNLAVWIDRSMMLDSTNLPPMRWQGVSAVHALQHLLAAHHLGLLASGSGRTFRIVRMGTPEIARAGEDHWLVADCRMPVTGAEIAAATVPTLDLIRSAAAFANPVPHAASQQHSPLVLGPGALPDVLRQLARQLGVEPVLDGSVPATFIESMFSELPPEVLLADLIDCFALGATWDPRSRRLYLLPEPFVPLQAAVELFAPREAHFSIVRDTAQRGAWMVDYDDNAAFAGDFFMGPQRATAPAVDAMLRTLQWHGNASLWLNQPAEAMADLEAIYGLIQRSSRIPLLQTWPDWLRSVRGYVDVARAGFDKNLWRTQEARAIARSLATLSPRSEIRRRLEVEAVRVESVLLSFPRPVVVHTLSQLDRDPDARVSGGDRMGLGLAALITIAGPKGWLEQNVATSRAYFRQIETTALAPTAPDAFVASGSKSNAVASSRSRLTPPIPGLRSDPFPYRFLADIALSTVEHQLTDILPGTDWRDLERDLEALRQLIVRVE